METQEIKNIEENDYVEEEVTEPVEITETMWYQHPTDRKNFEFLNVGQLTPLKRWGNTIISVDHLIEKYRMMYNNSNKNKLGPTAFNKKLAKESDLRNNLEMLYLNRIEQAINKGKKLEDHVDVHLEFLPASLGFDVDCYKIIAKKVEA